MLCKYQNLSSIPQTHIKIPGTCVWGDSVIPVLGKQRQERRLPQAHYLACLAEIDELQVSKRPVSKDMSCVPKEDNM